MMGETKAGDGWGSCSSGLEGEFSERSRPGRHSRDFQALTGYVNSADGPGLSGTMFSIPLTLPLRWGSFTSHQVLCSVCDQSHLCPSKGSGLCPRLAPTDPGDPWERAMPLSVVLIQSRALTQDVCSSGAEEGELITKNRDPRSVFRRVNMSHVLERAQVYLGGSAPGKGRPLFLLLDLLATLRNVLWTFNNIGC